MNEKRVEVPGTRWQMVRRLEYIETVLYWEGRINRSDLIERFGISEPQASEDIKKYMERAPENVEYDPKQKAYITKPTYSPQIIKPAADRYLMQLRSMKMGITRMRDLFVTTPPVFDVMPIPHRSVDTETLRKIVRAIRDKRSLNINYQSMSSPNPTDRVISPHAIAFDGYRWHVRSLCHKDRTFKDFVIARMLSTEIGEPTDANPELDVAWNTELCAILKPNPKLTPTQQKVVAIDHGMVENVLEVKIRASFVFYFERLIGRFTITGDTEAANQIEITNIAELKATATRLEKSSVEQSETQTK